MTRFNRGYDTPMWRRMMIFPVVAILLSACVTGCSREADFDAQAFGVTTAHTVVWVADILKSKHYVK